jgi:transposase InsO family protein
MGWCGKSVRDQRVEFVIRAKGGEGLSALCREFGISRPTGYLWLRRFERAGVAGIEERSRRPHCSPAQTSAELEERIESLRRERPDWGARKLAVLLGREGIVVPEIPVHRVLKRRGMVTGRKASPQARLRFEREQPNQLWQMDFKGQKGAAVSIGPLSVLDDHSRYLVGLEQTGSTRAEAVRERLEGLFRSHGVPAAMLMDHGVPWWSANVGGSGWTWLSVWLMRQGIRCVLSGVGHPQTQGKVERFHQSLEEARRRPGGERWLEQPWLDAFRYEHNHVRPHEALGMQVPATRWRPSLRAYDPAPRPWDYGEGAIVRKVDSAGHIYWNNHAFHVSRALVAQDVELEPAGERLLVFFCNCLVSEINLASHRTARAVRWLPNSPQL